MVHFDVHSTFIVKTNVRFMVTKVLFTILKASYGERTVGHWVIMKTKIANVPIFITIYAWSNTIVSYYVSSCGLTVPGPDINMVHYEDENGNPAFRQYNRPAFASNVMEYAPGIDEHNRKRQDIINIEGNWPTQCCWFRLLTTIVGQSAIDL